MKKPFIILILAALLISSCTPTGQTIKEEILVLDGPHLIINVVDGDTADVLINNKKERIRFSGINTPETGECYYQEAKERLEKLILDEYVYLEKDLTNKDKYEPRI